MGRGYTGESKSDKAFNRMDKAMDKSNRERERTEDIRETGDPENPILTQLKALYPETWSLELEKLRKEWSAEQAGTPIVKVYKDTGDYKRF